VFASLLVSLALLWPEWFFRSLPLLIHTALAAVFLRSLFGGREAIITRIARFDRGTLSSELEVYTRRLTSVWVGMLALLSLISIYFLFAEHLVGGYLLCYSLLGALFFGEQIYRRLRFPHYTNSSPWQLIRRIREMGALR
jgi:uncharacterized membrane protein